MDTAHSAIAPPQLPVDATPWQDHRGSGWAARPAGPPDEGVRVAWELSRDEVAGVIRKDTMDMLIMRCLCGGDMTLAGSEGTGFKQLCMQHMEHLAEDYVCRQLDEAVEELFVMGMEVGRVQLEAEDVEDSDSEAGSPGGGVHDDPAEDFPDPPQWWQ